MLVRQDGKTVFERGYGVRDLRSRERIDPTTAFRLASVTKQLTATAVMLLVRDGKLRYEDALTDLVPCLPGLREGDHDPSPAHPHLRPARLRGPDGGRGAGPLADLDRRPPDPRRRGAGAAAGRDEGPLRPGNELGLQQLGLRRAGPGRRAGLRQAVRGVPARARLRAARHGPDARLRARPERGGEPRLRSHARGATASARPIRARLRRRSATAASTRPSRISRSGTRPCARATLALSGGDEAGAHAGDARGRLGSRAGRRGRRAATTSRRESRWPTASAGSSIPGEVTRGCGTTARRSGSAR